MIAALALLAWQAPCASPEPLDPLAAAERLHDRVHDEYVHQEELLRFLELGLPEAGFRWAFAQGEELFEVAYTIRDGGGANVGRGQRYTRVPRPDLKGPGEWSTHVPPRTTGPNAASCTACHDTPVNDGSGGAHANVHRDPLRSGKYSDLIQRNTPHLFGAGAVQRLAEEMSAELAALRDGAVERVARSSREETVSLRSKGVDFGELRVLPGAKGAAPELDAAAVRGIDADLVVRPFGWKGDTAALRAFTRKALHEELGIQGAELVGEQDGDHDGVANEFSVGDVTALTLYVAGQPRPTTRVELAELGLISPLAEKELERIRHGEELFRAVGCAECHVPELVLADAHFSEPSTFSAFRDQRFPAGGDPRALGVDPEHALGFALDRELVDNTIEDAEGHPLSFGNFRRDGRGVVVGLYGDLKRHDLGSEVAEPIDETGTGASVFLTENLWGVGSTAPYLHDGRATTLAEAILAHGGEAAASRAAFLALAPVRQVELTTFLENLVLFKLERIPKSPGG